MPNTYTQLYIHCVFAVKYRQAVIQPEWKERLHKYITGIVQNNGHKLIAINSVEDHLHLFIGLNPKQSISDIMRLVKGDSSEFINKQLFIKTKFNWQEGYAVFSNSRSQINSIVEYIQNQEEHHRKKTFREEYIKMLSDYEVEYNEKYIFSLFTGLKGVAPRGIKTNALIKSYKQVAANAAIAERLAPMKKPV